MLRHQIGQVYHGGPLHAMKQAILVLKKTPKVTTSYQLPAFQEVGETFFNKCNFKIEIKIYLNVT